LIKCGQTTSGTIPKNYTWKREQDHKTMRLSSSSGTPRTLAKEEDIHLNCTKDI